MYTVYSKDDCQFCVKAKSLFAEMGIKYKEIKVGEDISSEDYRSMVPGFTTVPGIWHDKAFIGGYTDLLDFFGEKYLVD